MNNTFRECRSMVNITGLLCDLVTYTAITVSILGLSRWNKNWNVRNSYSYAATANKIRFHFQFPRSPDAEFGGLIGWLFNWKCKFSCRIISKIANYLKYNYFWDGDGIENVTSWLWKFSYFCSRHTCRRRGWWYHIPHSSYTRVSEVIMFSPCVFVCLFFCVSMFVTMFVRTIWLWRTGATQTIFCKYIVGDV